MEAVCNEAGRYIYISNMFFASGEVATFIRWCLHDNVFMQKWKDLSSFYMNMMKTHLKTEAFEIKGLSGDFINGTWKSTGIDSKNEYFREYEGHCQLIVM